MSKPLIQGIKGLTAKDRKKWEKEFEADIKGQDYTDEEINMAVFNTNFRKAFSNREDYAELQTLSDQEAINFWNAYIDSNENPITRYTVEHGDYTGNVQEGALPYNPKTGLPTNSIDELFGYSTSLNSNRKNIIDSNLDSFTFDTKDFIEKPEIKFDEKLYKTDPRYYYEIDNYSKQIRQIFDNDSNAEASYIAFKKFDAVASQVSNQYDYFKNTDRLGLTPGDVKDVMSYYYAITDLTGNEEEANTFIRDYIQNRIADRQTTGEKYKNAFKGIGASAIGSTIATYGALKAALGEAWNDEDYIEGLSGWSNYWNKVFNNELTRRGNDIITYQSFNKEDINVLKAADIQGNVFRSVEEEQGDLGDMLFSENFIPQMIQQHGFTVGSSLISLGTGLLAKGITKGVTKATTKAINTAGKLAGNSVKAKKAANATKEILETIGEKAGGFFAAGLAGTGESVINGLEQYNTMIDRGTQLIMKDYQEWANPKLEEYEQIIQSIIEEEESNRLYSDNPMSEEEKNYLYNSLRNAKIESLYQDYQTTQEDRFRQLEIEAIQAQNTRAAVDQMLTGFLNATLKSTLMHPSVKKTFGKIDKANPYTINEVTGAIEDLTTLTKVKKYAKGIFEEAFGEGLEEAGSEIGGGFAEGWHGSDFEKYLENGYNVVGEDAAHQNLAAGLWGGAKGLGAAIVDKNTLYSFISGAFSSGISFGNPVGVYNAAQALRDPNMSFKDKARAIQTAFIRSSFVEGYQNTKRELAEQKAEAKALLDLMKDPNNSNIYTDVVRLSNFASQRDMSTEDELHYRDSQLGTAISQITALEKFKDYAPIYYNTVMKQLNNYKNLDANSAEGKKAIEEYRNAGLASTNETDADIIETIKKNADELLQLKDKVLKRQQQIKRRYGNDLDDETVNAMVFGDISYDSYEERKQTMSKEVNDSFEKGKDSTTQLHENSNANTKQKQHIVKYGDAKTTLKKEKQLEESISDDEAKINSLKNNLKKAKRKDKSKIQTQIKTLEDRISNNKKTLKEMTTSYSKTGLDNTDVNNVLSEEDIMSLSNEDRAKVLSQDFYNNASKEQKEVIDNLKNILANGDATTESSNSLIKINDISRLEKAQKKHHEIRQSSRKDLTVYGKTIKINALNRMSKDRIKHIGSIEDYEQFKTALDEALNNVETSFMDMNNAESLLKDNANYKRYKNQQINTKILFDKASAAIKKDKSLTAEEVTAEMIMVGYLAANEVDIKDANKINELLTVENVKEYYNNISKGNTNPYINFSLELINDLKHKLNDGSNEVIQVERINDPIVITETDAKKDIPALDPVITVQDTEKEEIKNYKNYTVDNSVDEIVELILSDLSSKGINVLHDPNALSALVTCLLNPTNVNKAIILVGALNGFNNISVSEVQGFLKDEISKDEIEMDILSALNAKITIKEDGKIYNFDKDITDIVNSKILKKGSKQPLTPLNPDNSDDNSEVSYEITITGHSDYPEIDAKEKEHKVKEWLERHTGDKDRRIMVVPAIDIEGLNTEYGVPLYFVVKDSKEGTITIDGQKYQVIGVVPPIQGAEKGNTVIGQLQKMALKQNLKEFAFLKKETETGEIADEAYVTFKGFTIQSSSPEQTNIETPNTPVKNLISSLTGGIEEFFKRIVKGHKQSEYGTSKSILTYNSPFIKDKVIEHKVDKDPSEVAEADYIAFISRNGKPTDPADGGESQIQIFVETLDTYILPNGTPFLTALLNNNEKLFDPKDSGYFVARYLNTLYSKLSQDCQPVLTTMDANYNKLEKVPIILNSETLSRLTSFVENDLYNALKNFIYPTNVKLKLIQDYSEDKGLQIKVGFVTNDNIVLSTVDLGYFSSTDGVTVNYTSTFNKESILPFVKNAFTVNGKLRMVGGFPMFKVQINYDDIEKAKDAYGGTDTTSKAIINNLTEMINSGVLTVSKASLNRDNWGITTHKAVDSLISRKKSAPKQPEVGVLTPEGKRDPDTGIIIDKTMKTTPVTNPTIKEKLDKLVEAKKQRDARRKEGEQSNGASATSRNYLYTGEIDPVTGAVGNLYDGAIRDLINGDIETIKDITEKYPNFSEEEANNIFNYVEVLIEAATNDGWTLDAREMYLNTTLPKKDGSGEEEFHGIPDIVGYNEAGELIIIDIKTFTPGSIANAEQKAVSWGGQTSDYANALSKITGCVVKDVYAFPLQVSYPKESKVVDGTLREGLAFSNVTSEIRKFGKNILEKLNYSRIEIPREAPTTISTIASDSVPLGDEGLANFYSFMGMMSSEEEDQASVCNIPLNIGK